ncbi:MULTISPECIES: Bug family tripartite tricarboxylate transporter substrate binding protein [Roseomonadaceae]|uniref:Tripartite tricarboxylate transporter substrate binding protein n=1 Tax=Falsiroseomonas oleicola TaxID=2801474 RepID=A0ABS6H4Q5_9PROT|nr:tripartite tricarboxylate transporter substrate-binding protein [Roseomonas oleicola]MBU8543667.1 tripartite tricarboxylate transporter substrate binding protein [Roseomonas oleicola]
MLVSRRSLLVSGAAATLACTVSPATAQVFTRPVRLVVPIAPGGIVDSVGRILATGLAGPLGQTVVVENRAGGGGVVGTDVVAKAAKDGHTLLVSDSAIVVNPFLLPSLPYDFAADLQVVGMISASPLVVAVGPNLPVTSLAEFVALARSRAEPVTFASPGAGTMTHLAAELFGRQQGLRMTAVPYRGVAAAFPDIIAGRVDCVFSSIAGARGLIADGRLRGLATTGAERSPLLAELPTMAEGGVPDFVVDIWLGLFAPTGVPETTLVALRQGLEAALRDPATVATFAQTGNAVVLSSRPEAIAFVRAEYERWRAIAAAQPRPTN